jgi:hypothetical protein
LAQSLSRVDGVCHKMRSVPNAVLAALGDDRPMHRKIETRRKGVHSRFAHDKSALQCQSTLIRIRAEVAEVFPTFHLPLFS